MICYTTIEIPCYQAAALLAHWDSRGHLDAHGNVDRHVDLARVIKDRFREAMRMGAELHAQPGLVPVDEGEMIP